jgi:hypothetical protein
LMGQVKKHNLRKGAEDSLVKNFSNNYDLADEAIEERGVLVDLRKLNEETKCPICFGKIKRARVSIVCGHRYCGDCIDHCMRLEIPGRKPEVRECPVCRAHMPSRRSAKEDPNFDLLMKALYDNVAEYEEKEEALMQEDLKKHHDALAQEMKHMQTAQEHQVAAVQASKICRKRRAR